MTSTTAPPDARDTRFTRAYVKPDAARALTAAAPGTSIPFVASTSGIQRDGIDLRASGWTLARFNANPVFLWCHDYRSEPIGRVAAFADADRLRADVTFDQEDERARRIESKYRRGFANAVSVGWDFVDASGQALDWWRLTPEEMHGEAFYDLLELSGVPVPADPNALALRQRAALGALGRELVDLFDEQENPDSDVTAPDVRTAVRAELARLGLDADFGRSTVPAPVTVTVDTEAFARALASFHPQPTTELTVEPAPQAQDLPARAADIDTTAARAVLAAFDI